MRGVFAAREIKPEARVLAEDRGITCLMLDYDALRGVDDPTPHPRDEAYVVVSGSGQFVCGESRTPFAPGELLFVPAGTTHRFAEFSDDLTVWVIFYGPHGGE